MNYPTGHETKTGNGFNKREIGSAQENRRCRISLRQWAIFQAVVDYGGFANAAEHLHVSQSSISYTIGKMQEQLGVPILRLEGRKARITEEGIVLLKRSRMLLREAIELEDYAARLQSDQATEVKLAVDECFPSLLLMQAVRTFSSHYRTIKVRLLEASMCEIEDALHDRSVDLAITGRIPFGFVNHPLFELEYVPVAHPEHRLFKLRRELTLNDIENELQIIVQKEGSPGMAIEKMYGLQVAPRWEVRNVETAVSALCECLGYGWLAWHQIQAYLDSKKLKILPIRDCTTYKAHFHLIHGKSLEADCDANRLAEVLCRIGPNRNRSKPTDVPVVGLPVATS